MDNHDRNRLLRAITLRPTDRMRPAAARAGRALGVALAMLGAGSRFVPLGDNRQLLAEVADAARRAQP
jgi:hypothetical protein